MASEFPLARVTASQLWFTGPGQVEIREQVLSTPAPEQLLVRTECSAVSAGTELLVYRGQLPADITLDATLAALHSAPAFPLQYGYACVGRVEQMGDAVDKAWAGKRVFAFQPHASHFLATAQTVIELPDPISAENAVFLANMETAVNLVQDGNPALGEKVVVLGQGIVGLLLTSLLSRFPLAGLYAVEGLAARRSSALRCGVQYAADPDSPGQMQDLLGLLASADSAAGADLIYEVSGVAAALNTAITLSGYTSRIVIGSWYGSKSAAIELGGTAHRNRLRISTSQVSTLAPELSGRWNKARRFALSWRLLQQLDPAHLITHRVPLQEAATLYQRLDKNPQDMIQALITYS